MYPCDRALAHYIEILDIKNSFVFKTYLISSEEINIVFSRRKREAVRFKEL